MVTTYQTVAEAVAAGYASVKQDAIRFRGFRILSRDKSGVLFPQVSMGWIGTEIDEDVLNYAELFFRDVMPITADFGEAVFVEIVETRGCLRTSQDSLFYPPGVWEAGVAAAKAAIDRWYEAHPFARRMHLEWAIRSAAHNKEREHVRLGRAVSAL